MSSQMAGTGMKPMVPAPIQLYQLGTVVSGKPPEMIAEIPNKTLSIPSVMMNEGILNFTRMNPLSNPISNPMSIAASIAKMTPISIAKPNRDNKNPVTHVTITEDNAMDEPTDRSISPPMITIVIPIEITPVIAVARNIPTRLPILLNPGAKKMQKTMSANNTISSVCLDNVRPIFLSFALLTTH